MLVRDYIFKPSSSPGLTIIFLQDTGSSQEFIKDYSKSCLRKRF